MTHNKKSETVSGNIVKNIPNLLTALNMVAGFSVLYLNITKNTQDYRMISWGLILVAVVLDSFDGWAARRLGAESELGKQLDSFSDFLSFGIAPAAVLLNMESLNRSSFILIILLCYTLAGAFRLARYNSSNDKDFFVGLPITAAGFIQGFFGLVLDGSHIWHSVAIILLTATLSVMMISTFKVKRLISAKRIDKDVKSC